MLFSCFTKGGRVNVNEILKLHAQLERVLFPLYSWLVSCKKKKKKSIITPSFCRKL